MKPQIVLAAGLLGVITAVSLWDLWAVAQQRPEDTVSNLTREFSRAWPETLILLGILIHHLFGGVR